MLKQSLRDRAISPAPLRDSLPLWLGLLVVAVTMVVLAPVVHYDFVGWDDELHVYANPRLQPITWTHVGAFWRAPYEHLYIPLTYTVWAALVWLTQTLNPGPLTAGLFHGLNLLLHLGSVLVVYRLGLLCRKEPASDSWVAGAAAAGALLFGLHPLQVEAVAWVSGLKDVLCGWWALVALWQYLTYVRTPQGWRRWMHYGLATGAFGLALLAKPAAVVVPVVAGLLAMIGFGQSLGQTLRRLGGWLVVAGLWGLWTKGQQPDAVMAFIAPLWARPVVAGDALAFYLWKLVWPVGLGPDYGRSPQVVLGHAWGYVTGLAPVGLGVMVWWGRQRLRGVGMAAAVFTMGLLPVLGWTPFFFQEYSTVADRYVYLALVGPALGLGWVLHQMRSRKVVWVVGGLLLGLLGLRSAEQVRVWHDTVTLFVHALQVNPRSAVAHNQVGIALAHQEQLTEAMSHYTRALQLKPHYANAHNNLGLALVRQGKLNEAITHYIQALRLKPHMIEAHYNLGDALAMQGKLDTAIAHYTRALQLKPDLVAAYNNLGLAFVEQGKLDEAVVQYTAALRFRPDDAEVHYNLGNVLLRQGQHAEAIAHYTQAVRLKPTWADAHHNLGSTLASEGRITEAIVHYQAALRLYAELAKAHYNLGKALLHQKRLAEANQQFRAAKRSQASQAETHYNLGISFSRQGRKPEAIAAYRAALCLRPGWPQAAGNLAWLLAMQTLISAQTASEAVTLAEQACQSTDYRDATALYTLAVAYQAAGHEAMARAAAQRALARAEATGDTKIVAQIESRFPVSGRSEFMAPFCRLSTRFSTTLEVEGDEVVVWPKP